MRPSVCGAARRAGAPHTHADTTKRRDASTACAAPGNCGLGSSGRHGKERIPTDMDMQMKRLEGLSRDWKVSLHTCHITPIATRFATCAAHPFLRSAERVDFSVICCTSANAPGEYPVPASPTPFSTACASHSCGEQNPDLIIIAQNVGKTSIAMLWGQWGNQNYTYKTTLWQSAMNTPRKVSHLMSG